MTVDARRNSLTWPRAIAIVIFIFGMPALFRHRSLSLMRRPFDQAPVKLLGELRPECVLLGDSMLDSRIDPRALDKVSDIRCAVLPYPGSGTALWFLVYKNIIASQPHPPRWTIVFFRDKQLTMPTHRAMGRYENTIETCMRDDEPQFTSILHRARRHTGRWTERLATAAYYIQSEGPDWQNALKGAALGVVTNGSRRDGVRKAAERIFGSKSQRADQEVINAQNGDQMLYAIGHDFQANVEQSFLPPMLEIAREKGARLIFFRVKRRAQSFSSASADSPDEQIYQGELRAYLAGHGALLVDETSDPDVTFTYYGGDDHVRDEMKNAYTEMFWKKMRPRLDSADSADSPNIAAPAE
jgi:hypothetical protein